MKRGTILLTLGLAIVALMALATFYMGGITAPMILLGVAGLIVAAVGASRRWERG